MSEENEEIVQQNTEIPAQFPDEVTDDSEVVEFEFNEDGEEDLKKTLKKLRADLKQAKAEKEEYLTGWQKERAGFVNYRKEEEDRNTNFKNIIQERMMDKFLSVMDSFDMAFANKTAWEKVDANWRTGVEYIYNQMNSVFEDYGVQSIGKVGEKFNPELHQSVEHVPTDDQSKDDTISQVLQKGYKSKDKVLRPARVNVFGYKA
ncbi:MAG: nucleotide exchange factor GrpE [Candidatus Nomurabacteria bacterium]|nr:nucleotide exchange factor GrpE [Candidatus Nomurabacteria bacterium]